MLVEQFKSGNALLQNSLAYFQFFSARLGASADPATVSAVMALDSAMLQLTLDTSPAADEAVGGRPARLTPAGTPGGPNHFRAGFVAHRGERPFLLPPNHRLLDEASG